MKKIITIIILLLSTTYAYANETTTVTTSDPKEITIDAQSDTYHENNYSINDFHTPFLYSKNKPVTINIKSDKKIKTIAFGFEADTINQDIKIAKSKITLTSKSNKPFVRMLHLYISYIDDRYASSTLDAIFLPDTYPQDNPNQTSYTYKGSPKIINVNLGKSSTPTEETQSSNRM